MSDVLEQIQEARPRRFRPYPEYKDSGVAWLGEIPAHWEVTALKRLFRVVNGSTPKSGEPDYWNGDVPWITPDDLGKLQGRVLTTPERYITRKGYESCGTRMVPPASLVLSTRAPIGHLAIIEMPACTNQGCRSLVFRNSWDRTYFYFQLTAARPMLQASGQGSTFRELGKEDLESIALSLPPLDEQHAVAAFLDRETAKIDGLVAKKERLIELLQEKRTALITRAVTRGLDPNVPMKDSGVEWLGETPAHWEVKPLKHVAEFVNGVAFKPEEWGDEGTPIIRIENLNGGESFNHTTRNVPSRFHAQKGDLLFGWSGNRGTSFGPFHWWREGLHYVNQHIFKVETYGVDKAWLYWMLRGVTFYVEKQAHGIIGMVHITRGELGMVPIPTIPLAEQEAIAAFLDREAAKIDVLVTKVRQAIERLKEFRTALISAAVTGMIDVREEAP